MRRINIVLVVHRSHTHAHTLSCSLTTSAIRVIPIRQSHSVPVVCMRSMIQLIVSLAGRRSCSSVVSISRHHRLLNSVASRFVSSTSTVAGTTNKQRDVASQDEATDAPAVDRLETLRSQHNPQATSLFRLPSNFQPSHSISRFVAQFQTLVGSGQRLTDQPVVLAGRITKRRDASKKLIFYDLSSGGQKVQIMADRASALDQSEFDQIHSQIQRGDIVGIEGVPAKTKVGELSIVPCKTWLLTPCLQPIPHFHGLRDVVCGA
jgi:hypothetical protein